MDPQNEPKPPKLEDVDLPAADDVKEAGEWMEILCSDLTDYQEQNFRDFEHGQSRSGGLVNPGNYKKWRHSYILQMESDREDSP